MRFTATGVEFLKGNDPARSKVREQPAQCINRIRGIHQNESTNNYIEAFVESSQRWVTLDEVHIRHRWLSARAVARTIAHAARSNAHDLPGWTNEFARKQCYIATSTAHIEHTHSRKQAGFVEQLSCKCLVHSRL